LTNPSNDTISNCTYSDKNLSGSSLAEKRPSIAFCSFPGAEITNYQFFRNRLRKKISLSFSLATAFLYGGTPNLF